MKRIAIIILVMTLFSIWGQALLAQSSTLRLGHVGFPGSLFALKAHDARSLTGDLCTGPVIARSGTVSRDPWPSPSKLDPSQHERLSHRVIIGAEL